MTRPTTLFNKAQLQALESTLRQPNLWATLQHELANAKAQHTESGQVWHTTPVDMATFAGQLPGVLQSARITVFSPHTRTKIERHPNATQVVRLLEGQCIIRKRDNDDDEWDADPKYDSAGNLYQRWSIVPPNVWHCPVPLNDSGWSVLAFHTVLIGLLQTETPTS